jgi:hypothetical protein
MSLCRVSLIESLVQNTEDVVVVGHVVVGEETRGHCHSARPFASRRFDATTPATRASLSTARIGGPESPCRRIDVGATIGLGRIAPPRPSYDLA